MGHLWDSLHFQAQKLFLRTEHNPLHSFDHILAAKVQQCTWRS